MNFTDLSGRMVGPNCGSWGRATLFTRRGTHTYPVPYHKGKELGKGLVRKIRKEMDLK